MRPVTNASMHNSSEEESELRRGPWTLEEDTLLIHYITCHGEGRWNLLAKCAGLKRTGKSCRLRWLNYLKPDIKRGNLTPQEQILILELHSKWGNRWSKIAQHLPGRTDNEIKNYWRTRVQKQARQLKIDSNSKKFLEALRHFWMPRLLEKMEQNSPSSSESFTSASTAEVNNPAPFAELTSEPSKFLANCNDFLNENSSLSICSSDSVRMSQFPGNSAHPSSPIPNDCYYVDSTSFEMEGFNQPNMSAGCHVAELDWSNDYVAENLWNMDDLWQFSSK
ncbi:hypothetical protein RJ639_040706 [Escallonia herrerae]|uniref:Uncharacterized protein n=1 Tax=Escallonia herrerae TaxID=1293975 RepID=A0AA88WH54_9ASTE|nr:hypothetical protein RJ639_040706 [Escallonia herrerae]